MAWREFVCECVAWRVVYVWYVCGGWGVCVCMMGCEFVKECGFQCK